MKLAVLIDYDNLRETQKSSGVRDLITKFFFQMQLEPELNRGECNVRLYGGWYEEANMTPRAQDLSVEVQSEFPFVLRIPSRSGSVCTIRVDAELAVASIEEPGFHIFDTYRRKGKPTNVRIAKPEDVGCNDVTCPLPLLKKLLKKGNCPAANCAVEAKDLVYRHEQKTVDTLLACDLIHTSRLGVDTIVLVSADDDFLPPLRSALLQGSALIRLHPRPNSRRTKVEIRGRTIIEIDI